ncbi:HvfC/BufC family peptide modification chaperone [Nitrospira sp. M1]
MGTLTLNQYQRLFSHTACRQDHEAPDARLSKAITPGKDLTSHDALDVYRRGYLVRLTEALGETYEAVWWVAGDEEFFRLAKTFIQSYPSQTYNLSTYGAEFADFLEKARPFPDLLFLPDLARFEWLFKNIFHMPQHEPASQETIQAMTQQSNIRFQFGPSVHLFSAPYSIYNIWKLRGTCHDGQPQPDWNIAQHLLLYKKHQQIYVNELQQVEYNLLEHLCTGLSLEEALHHTLNHYPEMSQTEISQLFQVMVHTGMIQHITSTS